MDGGTLSKSHSAGGPQSISSEYVKLHASSDGVIKLQNSM